MKRKISLVLAALAYVGTPLLAWFALQRDAEARAAYEASCGNIMVSIVFFSVIFAAALSLIASAFALASFGKLSRPRSKLRGVELAVVALPFVVCTTCLALFLGGA